MKAVLEYGMRVGLAIGVPLTMGFISTEGTNSWNLNHGIENRYSLTSILLDVDIRTNHSLTKTEYVPLSDLDCFLIEADDYFYPSTSSELRENITSAISPLEGPVGICSLLFGIYCLIEPKRSYRDKNM